MTAHTNSRNNTYKKESTMKEYRPFTEFETAEIRCALAELRMSAADLIDELSGRANTPRPYVLAENTVSRSFWEDGTSLFGDDDLADIDSIAFEDDGEVIKVIAWPRA